MKSLKALAALSILLLASGCNVLQQTPQQLTSQPPSSSTEGQLSASEVITTQQQGDLEIQLRFVDQHPFPPLSLEDLKRMTPSGTLPPKPQPLAAVEGQIPLLVPTYLPAGFSYDQAYVHTPLRVKEGVLTSEGAPTLILHGPGYTRLTIQPLGRKVNLPVKQGFVRRLSDPVGYLIRGTWWTEYDQKGNVVSRTWSSEAVLSAIFFKDDQVVKVSIFPASALPDEELLKVARSLEWKR